MTTSDIVPLLKKYPTSVACTLVAIVCGALLYLRWDDSATSATELEARTAEANRMTANVRNATNLPEQLAEIQAQAREVESRLLKVGQLAVNLQYFYKLEAETEVKLTDVRQNNVARAAKSQFQAIPFSLTVQGTFEHVANFLMRLQNGRHFCRISAANLTRAGGLADTGSLADAPDMTLSLTLDLLGQP